MKIAEHHIPYTYQESKRVFEDNLTVKEAADNIHKNCDIKINSCSDYVYYFRYLMTGMGSCRLLNSYTQDYYLKEIKKDYDKKQFTKSLEAFYKLLRRFEEQNNSNKKSMRSIHEKYTKQV